jgi:hypothetical protein
MTKKDTTAAESTVNAAAEQAVQTVKTFTQIGADTFAKVIAESEKHVARSFEETERLMGEANKMVELQMQAARDLNGAWMDAAKKMQNAFQA